MTPAPPPLQPVMTFAEQSCSGLHRHPEAIGVLEEDVVARLDAGSLRLRIGRLGRVLLDQLDEASTLPLEDVESTGAAAGVKGEDNGRIGGPQNDEGGGLRVGSGLGERLRKLMSL